MFWLSGSFSNKFAGIGVSLLGNVGWQLHLVGSHLSLTARLAESNFWLVAFFSGSTDWLATTFVCLALLDHSHYWLVATFGWQPLLDISHFWLADTFSWWQLVAAKKGPSFCSPVNYTAYIL